MVAAIGDWKSLPRMSWKAQPLKHSSLSSSYFGGAESLISTEAPDGDGQTTTSWSMRYLPQTKIPDLNISKNKAYTKVRTPHL